MSTDTLCKQLRKPFNFKKGSVRAIKDENSGAVTLILDEYEIIVSTEEQLSDLSEAVDWALFLMSPLSEPNTVKEVQEDDTLRGYKEI